MNVVRLPACDEAGEFLEESDQVLAGLTAAERVRWALGALPGPFVLTSSFGAQAAVMLHLVSRERAKVPVVLIDTGYLFEETYAFADELTERLDLNLQVYRPKLSAAWQEARYGRLWEQGVDGIERYNTMNKVEPMSRALDELGARTWFAGLRTDQAQSRRDLPFVDCRSGRYKVLPVLDWSDRDVYLYLKAHELPYHPLWDQGYVSIGDVHTTRSLADVDSIDETRFFGLKRECGIHESF